MKYYWCLLNMIRRHIHCPFIKMFVSQYIIIFLIKLHLRCFFAITIVQFLLSSYKIVCKKKWKQQLQAPLTSRTFARHRGMLAITFWITCWSSCFYLFTRTSSICWFLRGWRSIECFPSVYQICSMGIKSGLVAIKAIVHDSGHVRSLIIMLRVSL